MHHRSSFSDPQNTGVSSKIGLYLDFMNIQNRKKDFKTKLKVAIFYFATFINKIPFKYIYIYSKFGVL